MHLFACSQCSLFRCDKPGQACEECGPRIPAQAAAVTAGLTHEQAAADVANRLHKAFSWSKTRRGNDYWAQVWSELVYISQKGIDAK